MTATKDRMSEKEVRKLLEQNALEILVVQKIIREKEQQGNPLWYGLPDLLYPKGMAPGTLAEDGSIARAPLGFEETDEQYELRQNAALKAFVESTLYVIKDMHKVEIVMVPEMERFICDLFFGRERRAILWKPRGGGGSLAGGILIWLCMVFRRMSFIDQAGSGEQAKVVYNYVKGFWSCVPKVKQHLLATDPMLTETRLTTGVQLKCITSSEKQARGKHLPGFLADESCVSDEGTGRAMLAAMQGAMSEPDNMIVLLSTFHVPVGFFQEHWDFAEEKGFARYKWDCFDTMQTCRVGIEEATEDDPKAVKNYCMSGRCPLTWEADKRDAIGRLKGKEWIGCCGKARDTKGWQTLESFIDAKRANAGTNVFEIEYMCLRPNWMKPVYDPELVDQTPIDEIEVDPQMPKCVGIDWGSETAGSMAIMLGVKCPEFIGVPEAILTDHIGMREVIQILEEFRETYGAFVVYADRSHPFNNRELESAGFAVQVVDFGSMKGLGIENIQRYLAYRRLKILSEFRVVREQMKNLRRNLKGQVIKKEDHACDSLLCMLLYFQFDESWPQDMSKSSRKSEAPAPLPSERGRSMTEVSSDGATILI